MNVKKDEDWIIASNELSNFVQNSRNTDMHCMNARDCNELRHFMQTQTDGKLYQRSNEGEFVEDIFAGYYFPSNITFGGRACIDTFAYTGISPATAPTAGVLHGRTDETEGQRRFVRILYQTKENGHIHEAYVSCKSDADLPRFTQDVQKPRDPDQLGHMGMLLAFRKALAQQVPLYEPRLPPELLRPDW